MTTKLTIRDEKDYIYLYSGMTLSESDINPLEGIVNRLFERIDKLEKNAPLPEGTRLNVLEHSHDTLWKAQIEAKKILEEMRVEIALVSRKFDHDHKAHTRIYKEIDYLKKTIERMDEKDFQRTETDIIRDKRISNIEEFMGDL